MPLGPTMSLAALVQTALALLPTVSGLPPAATSAGAAARAAAIPPTGLAAAVDEHPGFTSPLPWPLTVLDGFDPPAETWLPGHRGVDLAAVPGDPVVAAGAGIVVWAGSLAGRGVVSVLHGDGRRTTYEPLAATVEVGDVVDAGELLGWIAPGVSHCGGVPSCLHWGLVRGDDDYADPLALLAPPGRPRLLPVAGSAP